MAKTKSWKKYVKQQENNKKYLRASLRLYKKESAKYWQAITIAERTLTILNDCNPANVALKEIHKILYGDKWQ